MSARSTWDFFVLTIVSLLAFSGPMAGLSTAAPAPDASLASSSAATTYMAAVQAARQIAPTATAVPDSRPYRVALQIGHYKNNELPGELSSLLGQTGTAGGGRREVDLNYDVANRVANLLRAQGIVVNVLPATVPGGYTADAFIAIHADGNASARPRGFKISTRWRSEIAVQDTMLVHMLTDRYSAATGLPEDSNVTRNMRGYYAYASWRNRWRISNLTPGAIVEMGYMSNAADREVMFNSTDKVAQGIAIGITDFLKAAYGSPRQARQYGQGFIDKSINMSPTPPPTPTRSTTNSNSGGRQPGPQTGDWQVVMMGQPLINLYSERGGGRVVGQVARGQIVRSFLRNGDYYEITLPDGTKGWVHRNAVVVQM